MCIAKNHAPMPWTGSLISNVNDFFWIIFSAEDARFFTSKARKSHLQTSLTFSTGIYPLKGALLTIYRLKKVYKISLYFIKGTFFIQKVFLTYFEPFWTKYIMISTGQHCTC